PRDVTDGSLDAQFAPYDQRSMRERSGTYWLRLQALDDFRPGGLPALVVRKNRQVHLQVFEAGAGERDAMALATELPGIRGTHEALFVLHGSLSAGDALYARVQAPERGADDLSFSVSTLHDALQRSGRHAGMIALTFGAL